jgi:hypothetical protein
MLVMVRVLKDKVCERCQIVYSPKGTAQRYCDSCRILVRKEATIKQQIKKGVQVGIGSGNAQGTGKEHHTYKNGIGSYRKIAKENKSPFCEQCLTPIDFSNHYKWCVHHKDHDRTNNELDNLELLCKRCHQIEHDCESRLPQNRVKV